MISAFMRPEGPTQDEADKLVKKRKYIRKWPIMIEGEREYRMIATVFRRSLPNRPCGLTIKAHVKKAPSGVPRSLPSCVLELAGRFRIRGIDYAVVHSCPSGPIVYGWHEHTWTNRYEDRVVLRATPRITDQSIAGVFAWGLKKWNIDLGEPVIKKKAKRHGSAA